MDYINRQLFRMFILVCLIVIVMMFYQGSVLNSPITQEPAQSNSPDYVAIAMSDFERGTLSYLNSDDSQNIRMLPKAEPVAQPVDSSNPPAHKFCVSFWMGTTGENQ